MQGIYIKKSQELNTKSEIYHEFDDFVYSVLAQRYGSKKKIQLKGQEFFLALAHYANEDERIDFFKRFVGYEEARPYNRDILEFYLKLIKASNESIQNIMMLPTDDEPQSPCEKIFIESH